MRSPPEPRVAGELLVEVKHSAKALKSNSKIRGHYLNMVTMCNLLRAFIVNYELDPKYTEVQKALLKTLCDVESRKNRVYFTNDHAVIAAAIEVYETILESAENADINEMFAFIEKNEEQSKWVLYKDKVPKHLTPTFT